jgi:hypothetical protein
MATLSSIITPSNITTATNTQTLTNKTLTGAAMNGTVGATTPSTVAATTLSANTTNDVYGLKVNAADSRLRILGHLSGFGGALIDAVNTAESAHVPLLITSNNLTIRDEATDVASFSSTGLAVTGTLSATGTINAAQNVLIGSAAPAADTTTLLTFQGSNLQRNWRLGVNVAAGEVTLTPSTANGGTTYTTPVLTVTTAGLAVTGALSATGGISAIGTIGALTMASNSTNATTKEAKVVVKHYTNAEEDFLVFYPFSSATLNDIYYGGGSTAQNSATGHYFAASANNTTTSGTIVASITSTGLSLASGLKLTVLGSTADTSIDSKGAILAGSNGGAPLVIGVSGGDYPSSGYNFATTLTSGSYNYRNTDSTSRIEYYNGGFRFYGAASGTIGSAITYALRGELNSSGLAVTGTLSSTGAMKSGTTGTNGHLQLARSSDGATITNFVTDGTNGIINSVLDTIFQANTTERMRITSAGNVLIGTATAPTIAGVPSGSSVVRAGAGNWTWSVQSTSAGTNRGLAVNYSASSPNDTTSEMIFCYDSTGTQRFGVRSNGGIANYQANDANLSDERVKKDITPSDSYLAKMCAIEVVKFKYKDQTHDDYNLGVIAQQVEAVAPEFVDADGFNPLRNDEIPLKAIYQTDLSYGILKAVQELAEENKALRKRIEILESLS